MATPVVPKSPWRRPPFRCPECGSTAEPYRTWRITPGGWVIFAVFLVFFWPLFWVGLLIRERYERCDDCNRRIG